MKLLTYNTNNTLFILLDNLIIKKKVNTYNVYENNLLINVLNETKFYNYIKKKYKNYNYILNTINSKNVYSGGSLLEGIEQLKSSSTATTSTATETRIGADGKASEITKNIGEQLIDIFKKSNYIEDYKIVLLLSTIMPKSFNVNDIIKDIHKKLTATNLIIPESYLMNKLNENVYKTIIDICKLTNTKNLEKFLPKNDNTRMIEINNLINDSIKNNKSINISNSLLKPIVENINDINYLLNIKYSKCDKIDTIKCQEATPTRNNILCDLVKYRNTNIFQKTKNFSKKYVLPDNIEKSKNIINNITKDITNKLVEEKKTLSKVFLDYYSENLYNMLDEIITLDFIKKKFTVENIEKIKTYNNTLIEIILNTGKIITYSNINKYKEIQNEFKTVIKNTKSLDNNIINIDLLNIIVRFIINCNYLNILDKTLPNLINTQLVINSLIKYVISNNKNSYILTNIKKYNKYGSYINTNNFEENDLYNTLFNVIDNNLYFRYNIKKFDKVDKDFIDFAVDSKDTEKLMYKELDDIEDLIFNKSTILTETKEEFLNNIMFFYKKNLNNNWNLVIDVNKEEYYKIYVSKLLRNIRKYYKDKLESEFNIINNEYDNSLKDNELDKSEDEIKKDVRDVEKLNDESSKFNNMKFNKFKELQTEMNNIIKYIDIGVSNENTFFKYIINKYIIVKKKLPYDFSAEYEKTKEEYNTNLYELLSIFNNTNINNNNNNEDLKTQHSLAKTNYENLLEQYNKLTNSQKGGTKGTKGTTSAAQDLISMAQKAATSAKQEATSKAQKAASKAQEATTSATQDVTSMAHEATSMAQEAATSAVQDITSMAQEAATSMAQEAATSAVQDITSMAQEAATSAVQEATSVESNVYEKIENDPEKLKIKLDEAKKTYEELDFQLKNSSNKFEDFVGKMTNLIEDRDTNSNNINIAISKLQLMYFVQDNNYLKLMNLYSQLSDSYNKLIKLEKVNSMPLTSKPAILIIIDKLFINNLINKTTTETDEDTDEDDDLDSYKNVYDKEEQEQTNITKRKKVNKPAPPAKKIIYRLYDKLKFNKNNDIDITQQKTVVFNKKDGKIIN